MNFKKNTLYAAMFTAMVGLVGCSSGGDDNTDTTTAANVSGKITGFGSVYVDGVEFETHDTEIYIDGELATEDDLRVGMLVNLKGSDDGKNGNAVSISFDDEVEGVVTQADTGNGLEVMGLSISADGTTHFDGVTDTNGDGVIDLTDIPAGAKVEVSGYPDGNGGVHATYIELENDTYVDGDEIEVKGIISQLDVDSVGTFYIGNMKVDYSNADTTEAGTLADGLYVEVKANSAPDATTGVLAATEVELEDGGSYGVDGDDGDEMEVEGMISEITDTTITVNGQTFDIPAGIDVSGFAAGDLIDLDIEIVGGVATIHEIEDESHDDDHPGKIEVEAVVTATDTTVGSSSITLGGVTISVDPAKVVMLDYSGVVSDLPFNLGSIVAGTDRVEVEAIPNEAGDGYIAISIEREATSTDTYIELEGPVSVVNDGLTTTYSIAGVVVDLSSANFNETYTLANVTDGIEVSIKGNIVDGVLEPTNDDVELKIED